MRLSLLKLLALICLWSAPASAWAQAVPPTTPRMRATPAAPAQPAPVADAVLGRMTALEADTTLDAGVRDAALAELRGALEALQRRDAAAAEEAAFRQVAAEAPRLIEELRAELAVPPQAPTLDTEQAATLEALGAAVKAADAELNAAREELQRLQTDAAARMARLEELPKQISELRAKVSDMPASGSAAAGVVEEAREIRRRAERAALEAQISRLEAEGESDRARQDLTPLRRDRAQRRLDLATIAAKQWRDLEESRRSEEAKQREREAEQLQRQAAQEALPLARLAEEITGHAAARTGSGGIVEQLAKARGRLTDARLRLDRLEFRAASTVAKVSVAGLSDAVGVVLRKELSELEPAAALVPERRDLQVRIGEAQYRLIVVEERLAEVSDIEAALPRLLREIELSGTGAPRAAVDALARELLVNLRDVLTLLRAEYTQYIETAADLDTALLATSRVSEAYSAFIQERVLWTRSVPGQRLPRGKDLAEAIAWLTSPVEWRGVATQLRRGLWPPTPVSAVVAVLLVGSIALGVRARKRLVQIADAVRRVSTDRFVLTLAALPLTLILAAPLSLGLVLLSTLLAGAPDDSLAGALSEALRTLASFAFIVNAAIQGCRPAGLAEAHFRWSRDGLADFRRSLRVLYLAGMPLAAVTLVMNAVDNDLWNDALGRLSYIAGTLLVTWFYAYAFAPWRPFIGNHLRRDPGILLNRSRWIWYPTIVLIYVTCAVLAASGYFYTAVVLDRRVKLTLWLILLVVVLHAVFLRWLFIERRRLTMARAQQKRDALAEGAAEKVADAESLLDVPEIDTQTRRVLGAAIAAGLVIGLYPLWTDILPALRMLERVEIFPTVQIREAEPAAIAGLTASPLAQAPPEPAAAAAATQAPASPLPSLSMLPAPDAAAPAIGSALPVGTVTLHDVAIALIVVSLTWVLSRNLPGLLEITILKRLPLDAGSRFAVSAVLRYLLAVVGILLAFSSLGIGWSKVQWLVAALTFGLAFGLQEVFANFISGLIILIERPVRVGDTVTVSGVTGNVTRIQMRATTVRDWELKELIIPNKVFITDQVTNWTLTDTRVRLNIPVGVSYQADVRLVERTLLALAALEPRVVSDPKPRALFAGFGDSTLNFELRVFLDHVDSMLDVRSSLHMRITERFRDLGIEIAYPQRDLHIHAPEPLLDLVRINRDSRESEAVERG